MKRHLSRWSVSAGFEDGAVFFAVALLAADDAEQLDRRVRELAEVAIRAENKIKD